MPLPTACVALSALSPTADATSRALSATLLAACLALSIPLPAVSWALVEIPSSLCLVLVGLFAMVNLLVLGGALSIDRVSTPTAGGVSGTAAAVPRNGQRQSRCVVIPTRTCGT